MTDDERERRERVMETQRDPGDETEEPDEEVCLGRRLRNKRGYTHVRDERSP